MRRKARGSPSGHIRRTNRPLPIVGAADGMAARGLYAALVVRVRTGSRRFRDLWHQTRLRLGLGAEPVSKAALPDGRELLPLPTGQHGPPSPQWGWETTYLVWGFPNAILEIAENCCEEGTKSALFGRERFERLSCIVSWHFALDAHVPGEYTSAIGSGEPIVKGKGKGKKKPARGSSRREKQSLAEAEWYAKFAEFPPERIAGEKDLPKDVGISDVGAFLADVLKGIPANPADCRLRPASNPLLAGECHRDMAKGFRRPARPETVLARIAIAGW